MTELQGRETHLDVSEMRVTPTAEVCRKHGLSQGAFYKFKSQYGGMEVLDAEPSNCFSPIPQKRNRIARPTRGAVS